MYIHLLCIILIDYHLFSRCHYTTKKKQHATDSGLTLTLNYEQSILLEEKKGILIMLKAIINILRCKCQCHLINFLSFFVIVLAIREENSWERLNISSQATCQRQRERYRGHNGGLHPEITEREKRWRRFMIWWVDHLYILWPRINGRMIECRKGAIM